MSSDKCGRARNFLQLSRDIMKTPYYRDKPFNRGAALIDLMLLTQYEDVDEIKNGQMIRYERGHVYHSIEELRKRWGWKDNRRVKRFLDMLQDHGHITYTTSNRGTEIVMLHYNEWQGYSMTDGITESLETKELQPHRGMSDGRADSTADGKTDGSADGIQEIKHKTFNIEEYINTSSNISMKTVESGSDQDVQPLLTGMTVNGDDKKKNLDVTASHKQEFEELWKLYPKKRGRQDAYKHKKKKKKEGVTFQEIKDGIIKYSEYVKINDIEERYVKQGSTFFSQRAWQDDWTIKRKKLTNPFTEMRLKGGIL